jgi:ribonuclease P protein component
VADQPPCVAYAVSRPVGTAVVRNRVRRRLRALVAAAAADGALAPGDYLISAQPSAAERAYAELGRDLRAALGGLTPRTSP